MRSNPTFEVIQRLFQKNCRNFALRNMNQYRMKLYKENNHPIFNAIQFYHPRDISISRNS